MSLELLSQLEAKVESTIESLELLRLEMDDLKQENAALKEEKQAWEEKLGALLGKFSEMDDTNDSQADDETGSQDETDTEEASQPQQGSGI